MARTKAPVTAKTMIIRINRKLASDGSKLIKNRQGAAPDANCKHMTHRLEEIIKARQDATREHGAYCLVNNLGEVIKDHLNLEDFGRTEGLLKPHEYVIDIGPADKDYAIAYGEKVLLSFERRIRKIVRYQRKGFQFPPDLQVSDELINFLQI